MSNGKDICKYLKGLRRDIADSNGIELDSPECTYEGECDGTCPRCDYEIQYLEQEMTRRNILGKAAMVTAMTAALTSCANGTAQVVGRVAEPNADNQESLMADSCLFNGMVCDSLTRGPFVGAMVAVREKEGDQKTVAEVHTDAEGTFSLKLPAGSYEVEIAYIGYLPRRFDLDITNGKPVNKVFAFTEEDREELLMGIVPIYIEPPIKEIGTPESGDQIDEERIEHFPTP